MKVLSAMLKFRPAPKSTAWPQAVALLQMARQAAA
jgi:hypothetical protein